MKSQEQKMRLKDSQVKDKRRQLQQLRATILSFKKTVANLEEQISIEERKSGIYDINHFAYSIFAKSTRQRVDNLLISIKELLLKQESLEADLEKIDSEIDDCAAAEDRIKTNRVIF
ncbi:MAG: hypothetical protein C4617_04960 [Candidatus Liberibacter europaeus]|uniref:Flagellar export protein FliJ n=1 Tax=Candidatus Liberibacter europaeus TaxID=744859 RepID=A0A2T4VWS8_9HYPH|nr:hypothetical protein [Candidatus Liberibacter europaeus]PTL86222.1 MAG: hypothetical protein C4617_04960 [Candidatus Liberibacter europaeus]